MSPTLSRADWPGRGWLHEQTPRPATPLVHRAWRDSPAADIAQIVAIRQPLAEGVGDNGAPVTVTAVNRAFFLGPDYRPAPSFLALRTSLVLTVQQPQAPIWSP